MRKITLQQLKAVDGLMKGLTRKEALLQAGYSESVAANDAHSVFDNPVVAAEINKRRSRIASKANVDSQWIIDRLALIADANLGDMLEWDDKGYPHLAYDKMTDEMKYALGGLKLRKYKKGRGKSAIPVTELQITTADKLKALEMLGKHLGLFTTKVEVSVEEELADRLHKGRERVNASDNELD